MLSIVYDIGTVELSDWTIVRGAGTVQWTTDVHGVVNANVRLVAEFALVFLILYDALPDPVCGGSSWLPASAAIVNVYDGVAFTVDVPESEYTGDTPVALNFCRRRPPMVSAA